MERLLTLMTALTSKLFKTSTKQSKLLNTMKICNKKGTMPLTQGKRQAWTVLTKMKLKELSWSHHAEASFSKLKNKRRGKTNKKSKDTYTNQKTLKRTNNFGSRLKIM